MLSTLELLPLEVKQKIWKCCAKCDLVNLAICNKFLQSEVVPILWRDVSIEWGDLVDGRIDTKTSNLTHTQKLSFSGCFAKGHGYQGFNFAFILRNCDPAQVRSFSAFGHIVPHGLQLVAEMLPMLKILELSYIDEHIPSDLVSHFQLLQEVYLVGCEVTDEHVRKICLLENLRSLHIETKAFNKGMTGFSLKYISNVSALQKLYFRDKDDIPQGLLIGNIANLQNLVHLGLPSSKIEDSFFERAAGNFQKMEVLDISSSKITNSGLMSISKLHTLRRLDVSACFEITDDGFASLPQLQRLEHLRLSDTLITDHGICHVSKMMSLRFLDLHSCEELTDAGLEHVTNLQYLYSLGIGGNDNYTDVGFAFIGRLKNLTCLRMSCLLVTSKCFETISNLCYLEELDMPYCHNVIDEGVHHLSKLKRLKSLKMIDSTRSQHML